MIENSDIIGNTALTAGGMNAIVTIVSKCL